MRDDNLGGTSSRSIVTSDADERSNDLEQCVEEEYPCFSDAVSESISESECQSLMDHASDISSEQLCDEKQLNGYSCRTCCHDSCLQNGCNTQTEDAEVETSPPTTPDIDISPAEILVDNPSTNSTSETNAIEPADTESSIDDSEELNCPNSLPDVATPALPPTTEDLGCLEQDCDFVDVPATPEPSIHDSGEFKCPNYLPDVDTPALLPTIEDLGCAEQGCEIVEPENEKNEIVSTCQLKEKEEEETNRTVGVLMEERKQFVEENEQLRKEIELLKNKHHEYEVVAQYCTNNCTNESNSSSSSSSSSSSKCDCSSRVQNIEQGFPLSEVEHDKTKLLLMTSKKQKDASALHFSGDVFEGIAKQSDAEKRLSELRMIKRMGISEQKGKKILRWKKQQGNLQKVTILEKTRLMVRLVKTGSWYIGEEGNVSIQNGN